MLTAEQVDHVNRTKGLLFATMATYHLLPSTRLPPCSPDIFRPILVRKSKIRISDHLAGYLRQQNGYSTAIETFKRACLG